MNRGTHDGEVRPERHNTLQVGVYTGGFIPETASFRKFQKGLYPFLACNPAPIASPTANGPHIEMNEISVTSHAACAQILGSLPDIRQADTLQ